MGCNHNLCVSVTGIKDRFALEGEPLTREYASKMCIRDSTGAAKAVLRSLRRDVR